MTRQRILEVLIGLQRQFPGWVVWCDGTGQWTATRARPRSSVDPLGSSLLWVRADTAEELCARMMGQGR